MMHENQGLLRLWAPLLETWTMTEELGCYLGEGIVDWDVE